MVAQKHIQLFTQALNNDDIQAPISSDVSITNSTTPPFSDKLIMYHISMMAAGGIGNYATAAASQRSDLALNYERLSLEISQYAKDGADIMNEHAWLEQPPGTYDKDELSKKARNKVKRPPYVYILRLLSLKTFQKCN